MFYGWWIVAGAFASQILHSSLLFLSQGLYLVALENAYSWSRGSISWAFALVRIETGLLGPLQGWMVDRWGARPIMQAGVVLFGVGFIILGQIDRLWELFAALAIIAVGSSLAGFLTIHTAIAHWFIRKRARAMSMSSMGFAAGGIIAPLVAWSFIEFGWRATAVGSGVLIMLVGLPAAQLFRRRPEDHGLMPDGAERTESTTAGHAPLNIPGVSTVDFTLAEALRDRSFWFVAMGHGMALLVVATIPAHVVPHLVERNGWDTAVAALIFPGIMVMQIIGQFAGGYLGDRYSKPVVAAAGTLGHGVALTILAFDTSIVSVLIAISLHGLGWGSRGPLMMAIRADYFGRTNLGVIAGWSNVVTMGGSLVGPVYAGMMYDARGDYTVAFWTIGVVTIVSALLFLSARQPPAPGR